MKRHLPTESYTFCLAVSLAFTLLIIPAFSQTTCTDRPYFHYDCSQLARYCRASRAAGIRTSCPLTCGLCQKDLPNTRPERERPASGIVRLTPKDGPQEDVHRIIVATVSPNRQVENHRNAPTWLSTKPDKGTVGQQGSGQMNKAIAGQNEMQPRINAGPKRISDVDANKRLNTCCIASLIRPNCASLCSFDVSKEEVLLKAIAGVCTLDEARIWMHCAADGNANVDCCRNRGVVGCEDACSGQLGNDIAKLLECLNSYFEPIIACHRESLR